MNQSIEPTDDSQPYELTNFEQQLKQYRPRAPRLGDSFINPQAPIQTTSIPAPLGNRASASYSAAGLVSSIAASWIIGAVCGSAYMYFNLSSRDLAASKAISDPITNPRDLLGNRPSDPVAPSKDEAPQRPQPASSVASNFNLSGYEFGLEDWPLDSELGPMPKALSLSIRGRMIASINRSSQGIVNIDRRPESSTQVDVDLEAYTPTPPVSRAQLMHQYLTDPRGQVH